MANWKSRRGSLWTGPVGIAIDAVLVLAVVGLAAALIVPRVRPAAAESDAATSAGTVAVPTALPSTDQVRVTLDDTAFQRGHCYAWDQQDAPDVFPEDVPCADEHLFEAVTRAEVSQDDYPVGTSYPGEDTWDTLTQRYCAAAVDDYLGYALDPYGLYYIGLIRPTMDGWDQGRRRITCGLQRHSLDAHQAEGLIPSFAAAVRGADQSLVYPTGSCLAIAGSVVNGVVPCAEPHQEVAVGTITLPSGPGIPAPTDTQFDEIAAPRCLDLARSFLGAAYHDSAAEQTSWLRIRPESWEAGSHSFTCTVEYLAPDGTPRTVIGDPLADAVEA